MSEESKVPADAGWAWLEDWEEAIKLHKPDCPYLQKVDIEQLIACIKEMRIGLQFYSHDGDFSNAPEIAQETLTRCASGAFSDSDVSRKGEFESIGHTAQRALAWKPKK